MFSDAFVIALVGLLTLSIYRISISSYCLYDSRITIISIIRRFSLVVLSLIIYLYSDSKSVYTTIGKSLILSCWVTILIVVEKEISISTLATIVYSLDVRTALVTLLYLVKLVYIILPTIVKLFPSSPLTLVLITTINLIYELKSLLLAKELLTKT